VVAFYQSMSKMMAGRMDQLAEEQERQQGKR